MDDQGAGYQRVLDGVLADIRDGTYPAGGRLPSESALAETYGVQRSAVSWALSRLRWVALVVGPRGGTARVAAEPRRSAALQLLDEADRLRGMGDTPEVGTEGRGTGGPAQKG